MATRGTMTEFYEHEDLINKTQRYACLRKLVINDTESKKIQELIAQEKARDYSAQDEVEGIKL